LAGAISDADNAMALCTPPHASRHTNVPSIGLIAFGSVLVVVGVLLNDFPPKLPRMRWQTYRRLQQQYEELLG
jgi:hypothetical protein